MKPKFLLYPAIAMMVGGAVFTSCVDSDYDLSDIDGTAELQVKDLVLPINIDEIAMKEIIHLEDTGHIQVINGEYVLIDSGTYESDEIIVPSIIAKAPEIAPVYSKIKLIENNNTSSLKALAPSALPLVFEIGEQMSPFTYHEDGVSDFIVDVDMIMANFDINIDLVVGGLENNIKSWTLEGLKMRLPKGLTGETNMGIYDPETGIVEIGSVKVEGSTVNFKMAVTEVDIDKAGAVFENHSFTLSDKLGIQAGRVVVNAEDITSIENMPSVANFNVLFAMGDINVEVFGGVIQYSLDGVDIADVSVTGVPDVLSQCMTDLKLVNPQVYVCFSNPLGMAYGLYAQTGLTLTAKRNNQPDQKYSIDNDYFKLSCNGCQGCQFCLSPIDPGRGNYYGKFVDAQHVPFTSLSDLLSGNGLPDKIGISLDNPCIPAQKVGHFALGVNLGRVSGCYTIYAPLQLKDGSKIIYTSTETGWWDEEMDKLSIDHLQIDALVTNDLPIDVEITGYPIDRNGNEITGVVIEGMHLETGVEDSPLHISISGNIEHLDGVHFVATAKSTPSEPSLRPDEHIVLKNIKVKVSGHYKTEL